MRKAEGKPDRDCEENGNKRGVLAERPLRPGYVAWCGFIASTGSIARMFAALEPLPVHDNNPGKKDERERYGKGVIS